MFWLIRVIKIMLPMAVVGLGATLAGMGYMWYTEKEN